MVISVIGVGRLGATHAACLAELGCRVIAVDNDAEKIAALSRGEMPFFEPGLEELVRRHVATGRLTFSTELEPAATHASVHFICVGTPQGVDTLAADTSAVTSVVDALVRLIRRPALIVGKSTVPVGTAERIAWELDAAQGPAAAVDLAWNPEFLREGHAVADSLRPDRLVFGVRTPRAEQVLRRVYATAIAAGTPTIVTDLASAQLVKMAANAFLATKISFINAVAEVCEAAGGDILDVAAALGADARIGPGGLRPGLGFGGGCLPKDVRAFAHRASQLQASDLVGLLQQVDAVNLRCRDRVVDLADQMTRGLRGRSVAVLGAAFKPGCDDVRDSPSLHVAHALRQAGAHVRVYDPVTIVPEAERAGLVLTDSLAAAAFDSDLLVFCTDWPDLAEADPRSLAACVRHRRVIDARHLLDARRWVAAGWTYCAPGRPRAASARSAADEGAAGRVSA